MHFRHIVCYALTVELEKYLNYFQKAFLLNFVCLLYKIQYHGKLKVKNRVIINVSKLRRRLW